MDFWLLTREAVEYNRLHEKNRFFVWWTDDLTTPKLGVSHSFVVCDKTKLAHRSDSKHWCDAPLGEPTKPGLRTAWAGMSVRRAIEICDEWNRTIPWPLEVACVAGSE